MGNYSYLIEQTGCNIDTKKFSTLCNERKIKCYADLKDKDFNGTNLGDCIDGWKIQGYWYEDFNKMLVAAAESMLGLDYDNCNDYIEMEEEQGYRFWLRFYKDDKTEKAIVHVDWVPMDTFSFELDQDGKQINNIEGE
jgi:hypothetical protein